MYKYCMMKHAQTNRTVCLQQYCCFSSYKLTMGFQGPVQTSR